MLISIPVSAGELIDRLTILEIKLKRVKNKTKLKNIVYELNVLNLQLKKLLRTYPDRSTEFKKYKRRLHNINSKLWVKEDRIRKCEIRKKFGNEFIALARSIYKLNDERYNIKQMINSITDSFIIEEKEYTNR